MEQVAVIMGSTSDWETMKHSCEILEELGIPYIKKVVSAHRTPDLMFPLPKMQEKKG
ncbi:Phosphoribosylaminoimidazolecarboxylasecatalytic subunit [Enterococcus sp. HSIEG1]|nr:Phosphoribosylaminoimidazolecarboxylasecatalytic subunit [Enterococcus sp. HSIEG1]